MVQVGVLGFCLALVYWPVMMPLCLIALMFYCLPLVFLTVRLMVHALELSNTSMSTKYDTLNVLKANMTHKHYHSAFLFFQRPYFIYTCNIEGVIIYSVMSVSHYF